MLREKSFSERHPVATPTSFCDICGAATRWKVLKAIQKLAASVTFLQICTKNIRCELALQIDQCNATFKRVHTTGDGEPLSNRSVCFWPKFARPFLSRKFIALRSAELQDCRQSSRSHWRDGREWQSARVYEPDLRGHRARQDPAL